MLLSTRGVWSRKSRRRGILDMPPPPSIALEFGLERGESQMHGNEYIVLLINITRNNVSDEMN
jgi:hypothetical protein